MNRNYKKLAALMLCSGLVLTACGGNNNNANNGQAEATNAGANSSGAAETTAKAKISWMNMLHTASPPTDTVLNKIEELTNTEIEFSWVRIHPKKNASIPHSLLIPSRIWSP